ncbi:MAG TPA: serine hydrolase domain-containing protein, partial [Bacillota bacterium]|nr:serine hydrolase domain-containing protein [Bacillota bacterium]
MLQTMAGAAGMAGLALADDKQVPAPSVVRGFEPEELRAMRATAAAFLKKYAVPGLSVAVAKAGRLVYAEGFGLADKESHEKVTPSHLFRIASVSKPLTSV